METLQRARNTETLYDREVRFYDDTTTWLAEVLDGSMRTPFEYLYDGQELHGHDGSALAPIFTDAIEHAERLAEKNPQLAFELRRRYLELDEYRAMLSMAADELPNTMVVVSDFPPELMEEYKDVGGYSASRKQTMLRIITKGDDGRLLMRSQSLDKSDRLALESMCRSLGYEPQEGELLGQRMHVELSSEDQEFLTDQLTGVYDRSLQNQFGGLWHAGRRDTRRINTYDFVRQQGVLLQAFMSDKEGQATESQMLDLAAEMTRRFELARQQNYIQPAENTEYADEAAIQAARQQMQLAGQQARIEGKTFSGCGMSIKAGKDGKLTTPGELAEAGYGNTSEENEKNEDWAWKEGICRVDNCPTRPGKTKVGPCDVCQCCQKLFDKGKTPTDEYKLRKSKAQYN